MAQCLHPCLAQASGFASRLYTLAPALALRKRHTLAPASGLALAWYDLLLLRLDILERSEQLGFVRPTSVPELISA